MTDNVIKDLEAAVRTKEALHKTFINNIEARLKQQRDRIEKLEAALRLIAKADYGLQGMIEDGTDTPENKAEYYAGQVNRRRYTAVKALEGKDD